MHKCTTDADTPGHFFEAHGPVENIREASERFENLTGAILALIKSLHGLGSSLLVAAR